MNFRKKISALKVPHHKNTAGMHSVRISPPKEVLLPMSMHSGAPAVPVVEVGDHVRIGQLIAREDGKISSPVHATISGTVKAIETFTPNGGRPGLAIRIESDGKMEKDPNIVPPQIHDLDSFLAAVQESHVGRVESIYESHLGTHVAPAFRAYAGLIKLIHRAIHKSLHIEVGSSRTLGAETVLSERPDDFAAGVVVGEEDVAIVACKRISVAVDHLLGVGETVGVAVGAGPYLSIEIHAREEEPGSHLIHAGIFVLSRLFE